jgi:hypothetical protein
MVIKRNCNPIRRVVFLGVTTLRKRLTQTHTPKKVLNRGGFAEVRLVRLRASGQVFALKVISKGVARRRCLLDVRVCVCACACVCVHVCVHVCVCVCEP